MKIIRSTMSSETNWTTRKILQKLRDKEIDDNIDIQRPFVWKNNDKKSGFIRSLIIDRFILPLCFNKEEDIYQLVDGKQRILTMKKFIDCEFKLSGLEPIEVMNDDDEMEEIDINGLTYIDLPDCFKDAIMDYNFKIIFTDGASHEEMSDIFYNLNNGQAMNTATMNRLKAKSKDKIIEMGKHEVFKEALSEVAIDGHVNEDLIIKAHAMLYAENPAMDTKFIRPYMRNTEITDEQEKVIEEVLDRIKQVHDLTEDKSVARKIYRKTHFIGVVPVIEKSIMNGDTPEETMQWYVSFFIPGRKATKSQEYNMAAGTGSGKASAVEKRLEATLNSYDEFVAKKNENQVA